MRIKSACRKCITQLLIQIHPIGNQHNTWIGNFPIKGKIPR